VDSEGHRIGQQLRALRLSCGLTARQAAAQAGISQGYLSQIENGIFIPSARTMSKLARTYGAPEVELLVSAGIVKEMILERDATDIQPQIAAAFGDAARCLESILQVTRKGLSILSDEQSVGLFDCYGKPLHNLQGQPTGISMPSYFCNYDPSAFMVEAEDDDLHPLILRGDWVVVSPATVIYPEEIAVLHDGTKFLFRLYCKRGAMIGFHASATRFPSWEAETVEEQGISLVGRAVRLGNRELRRQIYFADPLAPSST